MPPHTADLLRLGDAIRRLRREQWRLSQEDFAERCEMHRTYLGEIERGQANVGWAHLARIAAALGVKPSELLRQAGL